MDERTARSETFGLEPGTVREYGTIAFWTSTRPLLVVNLTRRLKAPSFYAADEVYSYDEVGFLESFIADITQPIVRDGREHIEYVPSQIVTEYLRTTFRDVEGHRLDGILYPSARTEHGKCIVLFVGYEELHSPFGVGRDSPIVLDPASLRRVHPRRRRHV